MNDSAPNLFQAVATTSSGGALNARSNSLVHQRGGNYAAGITNNYDRVGGDALD